MSTAAQIEARLAKAQERADAASASVLELQRALGEAKREEARLLRNAPEDLHAMVTELRAERRRLGLTQQEVSKAMGMSRPTVSNLESGHCGCSVETLIAYARVVGLRVVLQPR